MSAKASVEAFLKEFCERFFSDYVGKPDLGSIHNKNIKSSISAADVTRHLSGVIFLEDLTALAEQPADLNVNAYFYWNPNAVHVLDGSKLDACLRARSAVDLRQ